MEAVLGTYMDIASKNDGGMGMREMVDRFDWSTTPVGPRADWPVELKTAVQMLLDSDFPKALAWGPEHTTIYNDAFRTILGRKPEALGQPFSLVWAEAWHELSPIVAAAFEGKSTFIEDFPLVVERGNAAENAFFTFCYSPVRLVDGTVGGMLDTVVETTKAVEARQELADVNQELAHRLANSLAIVRAIAGQTLRDATDPEALASFNGRLEALNHAHTVLLQQSWSTGSLRNAVWDSLEPHTDRSRISIDGADIEIGSKTTMALSMMLHELATNALKHGSLSNEEGSVAISWHTDEGDLHFEWRERDGPAVTLPERPGFGMRLVQRGFGGSGQSHLAFEQSGVIFSIDIPVEDLAR